MARIMVLWLLTSMAQPLARPVACDDLPGLGATSGEHRVHELTEGCFLSWSESYPPRGDCLECLD
jgi:hypothetical protein